MEESKHDTWKVVQAKLVNNKKKWEPGQTLRPFEVELNEILHRRSRSNYGGTEKNRRNQ